jgi:hypothetical protein
MAALSLAIGLLSTEPAKSPPLRRVSSSRGGVLNGAWGVSAKVGPGDRRVGLPLSREGRPLSSEAVLPAVWAAVAALSTAGASEEVKPGVMAVDTGVSVASSSQFGDQPARSIFWSVVCGRSDGVPRRGVRRVAGGVRGLSV